jgi:hypothetical protein
MIVIIRILARGIGICSVLLGKMKSNDDAQFRFAMSGEDNKSLAILRRRRAARRAAYLPCLSPDRYTADEAGVLHVIDTCAYPLGQGEACSVAQYIRPHKASMYEIFVLNIGTDRHARWRVMAELLEHLTRLTRSGASCTHLGHLETRQVYVLSPAWPSLTN